MLKSKMSKLKDNLEFQQVKPVYYHLEIADTFSKTSLYRANNIAGWQVLEKFLEDWRSSQQSNDVDIWISTTDNPVITTKTPI